MIDVTPNVPEVVAVEVLDGTFWESPHTNCDDERREESDAGLQAS